MSNQKTSNRTGFTIIEVVLVLAIAGLIFLMVFVALPALQRSQRDTARRNDMARVSTSLVQYQTNHSSSASSLPEGPGFYVDGTNCGGSMVAGEFIQGYMNSGTDPTVNTFEDPDGALYSMFITNNLAKVDNLSTNSTCEDVNAVLTGDATNGYTIGSEFKDHIVYVIPGATCDGETAVKAGKNNYAVLYRLEGAGVYCIDDQ